MSRISPIQRYEAFSEWLVWFNKEYGRTKKAKPEVQKGNTDKSFRVDVKGFKK